MARVSSFTVFLVVTVIAYTILASAAYAAVLGKEFRDPYSGRAQSWSLAPRYNYSEVHNFTRPAFLETQTITYAELEPDRKVGWYSAIIPLFHFTRGGVEWWDGWWQYEMEGSPIFEYEIIEAYDPISNCAYLIFDQGGRMETNCFVYPLANFETETFVYANLTESFANNEVTIVLATDATYPTYNIGIIFGVLTGFASYGAPIHLAILIGGIWWALMILTVVKLVVG